MKNIILKYNDKIVFFLLLGLSLFPLFRKAIESSLMILLSLAAIAFFIIEGKNHWNKERAHIFFAQSSLFFIALISLLYTENIEYGLKCVQRFLPLLLFPMIFLFNEKDILNNYKIKVIKLFYIGSTLFFLVLTHIAFLQIENLTFLQKRDLFEEFTLVHGTYFSIWIGFGVILLTFLLDELNIKNNKKIFVLANLIILYFIYWQYTIGARMPFFVTVLFLIFYSIYKIKNWLIFGALIMGLVLLVGIQRDGLSNRIYNLTNYDFSFPKGQYSTNYINISTEQVRNGIYYCAFNTIKNSPFIGYGVGDADSRLQQCYDETFIDTDTYKLFNFNSHNEYLHILLVSGIVGLLVFFVSVGVLLKKAIRMKNKIYISFLFYILLNFCFENVLSRHDGILFFSFFNSLLYFQTNKDS